MTQVRTQPDHRDLMGLMSPIEPKGLELTKLKIKNNSLSKSLRHHNRTGIVLREKNGTPAFLKFIIRNSC